MKDYAYCIAKKCEKAKECNRNIAKHIIQGVPKWFIQEEECIATGYANLDIKEKKNDRS